MKEHTENAYSDSTFRFNGKEWDEETGNFYYGARYYDPKISVWLSVDPLAHEYPHVTPYNFVENNPLMLVDPDGREVRISGSEKKSAYKQLRKALKREGIKLSREKIASGYVLNYSEKSKGANYSQGVSTLLLVISDDNIDLDIHAVESAIIDYDREGGVSHVSNGGSFMGTNYTSDDDCASTTQLVVPRMIGSLESSASIPSGETMLHEATEGAIASYLGLSGQTSIAPGRSNNTLYQKADAAAFPQPFDNYNVNYMRGGKKASSPFNADSMIWTLERNNQFGSPENIDFWIEYLPH